MKKPRAYVLEQLIGSTNHRLFLEAEEDDVDKFAFISSHHAIRLRPRNLRAMAKRAIAMADWIEEHAIKGK